MTISLHSLRGMLKLSVRCSCRRGSSLSFMRLLSSAAAGSPSLLRSPRFRAAPCSCTSELRLRLRGRADCDERRPCVRASLIAAACSNLHAKHGCKHTAQHTIEQHNEFVREKSQTKESVKTGKIFQLVPHPSKFSLVPPVGWRQNVDFFLSFGRFGRNIDFLSVLCHFLHCKTGVICDVTNRKTRYKTSYPRINIHAGDENRINWNAWHNPTLSNLNQKTN